MAKPFKIDEDLDAAELAALDKFCRERRRTIDDVHEWLQAAGFTMSRGAVGNWKGAFEEQLTKERFSRSGELARAIKGAVAGGNFTDVAEAAAMQLTQVVFEQSASLEAEGAIDALTVQRWTKSLANLIGSKGGIEELERRQRDAVAVAEKQVKTGASAGDVVATIKAALGITA